MTDVLDFSTEEKSKAGVRMALRHPRTEEPLSHQAKGDKSPREMYLTLLGPESGAVRRGLEQVRNRDARRKKNHVSSDQEIEAERVSDAKLMAKVTLDGLVFMDGAWVEITPDNAFDFYHKVSIFRGQALGFVLDSSNFTRG